MLGYGISSGLLSINAAAYVKPPRKQHSKAPTDTKPKAEPWTEDELRRFRAVADTDEWAACWRLTLCGLRRSEVMGLTWDCVDLERGEVRIEHGRVLLDGHRTATDDPKSSASRRTISVDEAQPGTVALLRSLRARQAADRLSLGAGYLETGLVLVDVLGRPVRPELYSDRFRRLSRQAGLRPIHIHLIRPRWAWPWIDTEWPSWMLPPSWVTPRTSMSTPTSDVLSRVQSPLPVLSGRLWRVGLEMILKRGPVLVRWSISSRSGKYALTRC